VGSRHHIKTLFKGSLRQEGAVVGVIVYGQQDGALLDLGCVAEQGVQGLDQVSLSQVTPGPGRQRAEIAEEPVGARSQRSLAFVRVDMNACDQQDRDVRGGGVALEDLGHPEGGLLAHDATRSNEPTRGIRNRKVLPRPWRLSTQILPPCISTSRLESTRPIPAPS